MRTGSDYDHSGGHMSVHVRGRRVHGGVYTRDEDVRRVYAAELRHERRVAERSAVPELVQRRGVFGDVHTGRDDLQRARRPDL